jgi:hypothetical protein
LYRYTAGVEEIKKAMAPIIAKHFPTKESVAAAKEAAAAAAAEGGEAAEGGAAKEEGGKETEKEEEVDLTPRTFAVMFAARANNSMKRADVIPAVAGLVPAPHKVDLGAPDLTIMCEVMKGTCCISVVRDYYPLLKYNQRLLGMSEEERDAEKGKTTSQPKAAVAAAAEAADAAALAAAAARRAAVAAAAAAAAAPTPAAE